MKNEEDVQMETTDNIKIALKCRRIWKNSSIFWMILDYVINVTAFTASIAAIVVEVLIPRNTIWVILFSTLAASLTFLGFTINPKHKMRIYRRAFCEINAILIRHFEDESGTASNAAEAIIKGENIINSTYDID